MFDAHRHDEFSFFDGSGKAVELAKLAKEKGYTYVFDSGVGVLLYSNDSDDIMPLVKEKLKLK